MGCSQCRVWSTQSPQSQQCVSSPYTCKHSRRQRCPVRPGPLLTNGGTHPRLRWVRPGGVRAHLARCTHGYMVVIQRPHQVVGTCSLILPLRGVDLAARSRTWPMRKRGSLVSGSTSTWVMVFRQCHEWINRFEMITP